MSDFSDEYLNGQQDATLEGRVEEDGGGTAWAPQAVGNENETGSRSWQEMAYRQQQAQMQQRDAAFQQKLNGYAQLEIDAKRQDAAIQADRGTALLAAMDSIRQNGGMMSPALNQAMSASFGIPVSGAFLVDKGKMAGTMVVTTPQKDANGQLRNGIGMMISPAQRYQIFRRLNISQAQPYMMADYAAIKQSSGLTDDQLANRGFANPSGPHVVGATTDGRATSRLFGITSKPKPRSGIHAFGADGKGGWTNYDSDESTNFNMRVTEGGTRMREDEARKAGLAARVAVAKNGNKDAISVMQEMGKNARSNAKRIADIEEGKRKDKLARDKMDQDEYLAKLKGLQDRMKDAVGEDEKKKIQGEIDALNESRRYSNNGGVQQERKPQINGDTDVRTSIPSGEKTASQSESSSRTSVTLKPGEEEKTEDEYKTARAEGKPTRIVNGNDKTHYIVGKGNREDSVVDGSPVNTEDKNVGSSSDKKEIYDAKRVIHERYGNFIGKRSIQEVTQEVASEIAREKGIKLVNPYGSMANISEFDKQDIYATVREIYENAGRIDEFEKEIEGYGPNGSYPFAVCFKNLFKGWNNKEAPLKYNPKRKTSGFVSSHRKSNSSKDNDKNEDS